ncbi:MAG: phosphoribosylformylglycinamidine cyclo-ligase [Dehalococcoidia bacterium]|nr:phosphoribosylformylglycinamidine cyclo-ligase [Dehalococcoidia bacterium]RLC64509.1 MAG: phosphoribosylformylglycinamidine cyclo-ligase [Chloroflexota bacterium]
MKSTSREAYALAGVDVSLANKVKNTVAQQVRATLRPEVIGSGFFGSMFQLKGYDEPVLVSSVDGVGTKLKIASLLDKNNTVGMDIVNHCVNDILCCGAEPLFFLDYIAAGKLVPKQIEAIVSGLVQACQETGCSLIGGETAEMPGIYSERNYDLAGFIVGVVERKNIIDGSSIAPDDVILGLPSSGLHTNGYSLVRRVFGVDANPSCLNKFYPELGKSLGEELLQVHRCYYPQLKPALPFIKGIAHITGGGFAGNIPRILPEGVAAHLKKHSWDVLPIFKLIQKTGNIDETEMYHVFNMGIGMTLVCSPQQVATIASILPQAKTVGKIIKRESEERVIIN